MHHDCCTTSFTTQTVTETQPLFLTSKIDLRFSSVHFSPTTPLPLFLRAISAVRPFANHSFSLDIHKAMSRDAIWKLFTSLFDMAKRPTRLRSVAWFGKAFAFCTGAVHIHLTSSSTRTYGVIKELSNTYDCQVQLHRVCSYIPVHTIRSERKPNLVVFRYR